MQEAEEGDSGLDVLVHKLNFWVRLVGFPVRKMEAMVVGDSRRVGAVVTGVLEKGWAYVTVRESTMLDATKVRKENVVKLIIM